MSSNERRREKRAEDDAAYEAECERREAAERERKEKFGELEARLEELGIDAYLLKEWFNTP